MSSALQLGAKGGEKGGFGSKIRAVQDRKSNRPKKQEKTVAERVRPSGVYQLQAKQLGRVLAEVVEWLSRGVGKGGGQGL